jgi:Glycosyl hydrolase catalytic core
VHVIIATMPESQEPIKKRTLLWDWTNTAHTPQSIEHIDFSTSSPLCSVSNWNTWTPPELKGRLPFRPMLRTPAQLDGQEWNNLLSSISAETEAKGEVIIHFYNEPERQNITPTDAIKSWKEKIFPLRKEWKPKARTFAL